MFASAVGIEFNLLIMLDFKNKVRNRYLLYVLSV